MYVWVDALVAVWSNVARLAVSGTMDTENILMAMKAIPVIGVGVPQFRTGFVFRDIW